MKYKMHAITKKVFYTFFSLCFFIFPISGFAFTNLFVGATCTAYDSFSGLYDGSKLVDQNIATRWDGNYTMPNWVTCDIGSSEVTNLWSINVVEFGVDTAVKNIGVYGSNDNVNFTTLSSTTVGSSVADESYLEYSYANTAPFRYYFFYFADSYTIDISAYELGIYDDGSGGSASSTTENMSTTTNAILGSIAFGNTILIVLVFIAFCGYIYNKFTVKKPWK